MTVFQKFKFFAQLILRALRGENHDFTQGSISEAVVLLAIPMILELGLESVFAVVDIFFVSKLGAGAIATVGLTESVEMIVYSLGIGVSTAATALVARRTGEKEEFKANQAAAQALLLGLAFSLALGILGFIYARSILTWMGAGSAVVEQGYVFTQIMLSASPVVVLLFLINGIFRGVGDAAMAMKSLWLASGLNIILCPIMIHFFGLKGAAIATVLGRSSGVLYQIYSLKKGLNHVHLAWAVFKPVWPVIKALLSIAWPASIQFLIGSGSWILLTRMVAENGGTEASAAYQIAFRTFIFFILPAWGLSNAAATLVGQNLGAGRTDRAEQSVYQTVKLSASMMALVSLFCMIFSEALISVFTQDPSIKNYAVDALRIIGSGFIFYGVGMVMTQALNGAGDTKTPTWLNFICFWLFQAPLAYFFVHFLDFKVMGAVMAIPAAHFLLAGISLYYFRKGDWKSIGI